jgi:DNA-binding NarL/FixJ family response regulator
MYPPTTGLALFVAFRDLAIFVLGVWYFGIDILIIADDPSSMQELKHKLQDEGYGVTCCLNKEKGLTAIEESEFDVVIIDLEHTLTFLASSPFAVPPQPRLRSRGPLQKVIFLLLQI